MRCHLAARCACTPQIKNLTPEENTVLAPGHYLKVSISDHGEGITPEVAAKMFDPYFTTKALASGLGLSISQSIVKKHGGLLHLESSSADGSTFAFYLPAAEVKISAPKASGRERRFNFDRQRVLVMDDDESIRELTSQLLGTLGYDVTAVPDGVEAIRAYERALRAGEKFQAVILDATVRGGLGGVPTIERLRQGRSGRDRDYLQRLFRRRRADGILELRISSRIAKTVHAH